MVPPYLSFDVVLSTSKYLCVHLYMYVYYIHLYMYVSINTCVYVDVYACTYICVCVCIYVYVCMFACMHVCMNVCKYDSLSKLVQGGTIYLRGKRIFDAVWEHLIEERNVKDAQNVCVKRGGGGTCGLNMSNVGICV